MTLTDDKIKEIAELLECGMVCYIHKHTLNIEYYPDYNELYMDPEEWEDTIKKVQSHLDEYICIKKMDAKHAFQVMEAFTRTLTDLEFKQELEHCLSTKKPFQNFRFLMVNSKYKSMWLEHKKQAIINWVRHQLDF